MNYKINRKDGHDAIFTTHSTKSKVIVDGTFSILQRFN